MFCTNCGKQVPDDSAFCVYCGEAIKKTSQPIKRDIPPADPYIPAGGYDPYRPAKKNGGAAGTIITVIGAILVFAALAWMWILAGTTPDFYSFMVYILPMLVIGFLAIIWAALDKPHAVVTVALMTIGYYLGSWIYGLDTGNLAGYNYVFMIGAIVILIGGIVGISENKNR